MLSASVPSSSISHSSSTPFLESCMAVVADSVEEVIEFFEDEGIDMDGAVGDEILEADEVFDVGDGRYLIVTG